MEERTIMHYGSSHKILLVGEGDFSFSLCLARAFGTARNMVATSLDSRVSLGVNYANALRNLAELESLGCTIVHEVDVHSMTHHPRLMNNNFDRIIYNFPHAGFDFRESNSFQIGLHKNLVSGFLRNAKSMLATNGEIHITHKTAHPFSDWDIKKLAQNEGLFSFGEVPFYQHFYPGYNNKRGAGSRCDESFPVGSSSTFKFTKHSIFSLYYDLI
ncbi:S-adenosyl-L-methionine-dependent methyltransferase [Sesbania bispinosa]|nr:S-adenosyl-L-methionine-dependent methyltransferase [Sesbania bispinosa]